MSKRRYGLVGDKRLLEVAFRSHFGMDGNEQSTHVGRIRVVLIVEIQETGTEGGKKTCAYKKYSQHYCTDIQLHGFRYK